MTTDQRCRTCKHWGPAIEGRDAMYCNHDKLGDLPEAINERDGLYPEDERGICGAWIVTGPDFGCVHWEGKE